jgi:hypothetical protein
VNILRIACFLVAVGIAESGGRTLVQSAPASVTKKRNPFEGNGKAGAAGAKLFARECASCHGVNREGRRKAPPLNHPEVRKAPSGALFLGLAEWVASSGDAFLLRTCPKHNAGKSSPF